MTAITPELIEKKKITIIKTTAARWAREARVPGMKLHINTRKPAQPWGRTSAGHTVTRKPAQAGRFQYAITSPAWEYPILFEVAGVPESAAREAMRLASYKLGIRTRLVVRNPHS